MYVIKAIGRKMHQQQRTSVSCWRLCRLCHRLGLKTLPGYPQSNGLVERTVSTVRNIMAKAKTDCSNPLVLMLEYCTTPVDSLACPAQLLPPSYQQWTTSWSGWPSTQLTSFSDVNSSRPHGRVLWLNRPPTAAIEDPRPDLLPAVQMGQLAASQGHCP